MAMVMIQSKRFEYLLAKVLPLLPSSLNFSSVGLS